MAKLTTLDQASNALNEAGFNTYLNPADEDGYYCDQIEIIVGGRYYEVLKESDLPYCKEVLLRQAGKCKEMREVEMNAPETTCIEDEF